MADIFDAPRKAGFGVGVAVIVTDDNGQQISSTEQELYGFENAMADAAAKQIVNAFEAVVEEWTKAKYGGRPKRG